MSMSTHLVGYISPDNPEYQKHKKILLACNEADVSLPKETAEYFGDTSPELYLLDEKLEFDLKKNVHYREYNAEMEEGFEIILVEIPSGVHKIRFYNSY